MKGELIYKIFKFIEDEAWDHMDFVHAFLISGYGATGGKINSNLSKLRSKRINKNTNKRNIKDKEQYLKQYFSKLKTQGFIKSDDSKKISLTSKGKKKLNIFKRSPNLNADSYKNGTSDRVVVVSYDIPEHKRKERGILRSMLRMLDFTMAHQSVWIGRTLFSEKFMNYLGQMDILRYVKIMEITKSGTIAKLKT
ncbi:MAG: hypothetical protein AAB873_02420 [Patescibacteria group bacterium]